MTVDDRSRLRLHRRLEEVLGADEASSLMAYLPPTTWQDVATKQDLEVLANTLRIEMYKGFTRQTWLMVTFVTALNTVLAAILTLAN